MKLILALAATAFACCICTSCISNEEDVPSPPESEVNVISPGNA